MQAVDDVDFGERLVGALAQLVEHLLERHRVRAGVAGPQPRERTEETARHADVRRFEPQVEVVVRHARRAAARARDSPASRPRADPDTRTAGRRRRASAARRLELVGDVGETECLQAGIDGAPIPMPIADARLNADAHRTMSRSVRVRGPSSSARRMRCHWPSTTSPPLT